MQSSYTFTAGSAVFDEQDLVSAAGLVPVLELAEQTGLSWLIDEHVELSSTRVKSGAVNTAGKLTSIIAGIMCGADSIDDAQVLRAGGTPRVFNEVYAPSMLGISLREFTFGHANQLAAVARAHLVALAARAPLLPGAEERVFIDIDSLLRPVYGHQKQGASFGHAKIASRALQRLGLSPQITTLSIAQAAPVIADARLRNPRAAGPAPAVAGDGVVMGISVGRRGGRFVQAIASGPFHIVDTRDVGWPADRSEILVAPRWRTLRSTRPLRSPRHSRSVAA